jgi:hypothetical protein
MTIAEPLEHIVAGESKTLEFGTVFGATRIGFQVSFQGWLWAADRFRRFF